MISKTDQKNKIIEKIIPVLTELCSYGFTPPQLIQQEWSTTLRLMEANIALEIEIDWRDFDIFVLVVRLENGMLPSGYYVSHGLPCRYHLQKIISDRVWKVDQKSLDIISPGHKGKKLRHDFSEDGMFNRFLAYKNVLDCCIENIVKEGNDIFSH